LSKPTLSRSLGKSTIHDLIDRVNRFPFTGTATKDENTRDELELGVIGIVMALILVVLTRDEAGNAHGLPAVTAQNPAKVLRRGFYRHGDCSFDRFNKAQETGAYKMAREFVHKEDNKRLRK
jgi:hypothetical protein